MGIFLSHTGYINVCLFLTTEPKERWQVKLGMATKDEDFVVELFVANTHVPIFFFSSKGKVYQLKTHRLPLSSAQSRGKAMVNLLPLESDEKITTVLPVPENKEEWEDLFILFATTHGNIRRNKLEDFANIRSNGLIAIKLEGEEALVGVHLCKENQDVILSTRLGKCIRFPITALRVFAGRSSNGVRGIKLSLKDSVNSMSVLSQTDFTSEERESYLRMASKERRGEETPENDDESSVQALLTPEQYESMAQQEEFILSIAERGFAKRTSAYAYRRTNRGGQGITNMALSSKTGSIVSSFPVESEDQVILVTDQGQLIRCPVHDIRICGRQSQGVILFRVQKEETVVSSALVKEQDLMGEDAEGEEIIPQGEDNVS